MSSTTSRRGRKAQNRSGMVIIACVVLVFCVVLMVNCAKLNEKLTGYQTSITELQAQIEEQTEKKAALENKEIYMNSDEYYKELAREKLGLAGSNDIIFKKGN
jgi:cell division protein DivIC